MKPTNDVYRPAGDGARGLHRGWYALMAVVIGSAACSSNSSQAAGPSLPGAITVNTQTAGFFKDTSYDLLVNGQSKGAIGANTAMTITGLDPATYQVNLGNLTDNCTGQGDDSVAVSAGDTATVSLGVNCTYTSSTSYTLVYQRDRPDLDSGQITSCPFGFCSTQQGWDLWVDWNSSSTPHAIIVQNGTTGVEIAHLPGVTLNTLTETDYAGATFTTDTISDPFDSTRVILIKTDLGHVYALGNPVEDATAQSLTFDAALIDSIG